MKLGAVVTRWKTVRGRPPLKMLWPFKNLPSEDPQDPVARE